MKQIMLSHDLYKDGMDYLNEYVTTVVANSSNMRESIEILKKSDGLILRVGRIDREVMEECENLKVISRPGVGVDSVDVDAATALGIPVVISPGTNARSVAEHSVALAYAICKNVVESHTKTSVGDFGIRNKYMAIEFENKNVGVIGFGNIGKMTARLYNCNDMKIHVYDPFVTKEDVENLGYTYHSNLDECIKESDIISLHVPLTEDTRNLISKHEFDVMKEGKFIVNCARGEIVDEKALFDALVSGKVSGAAVDVMSDEPMDPNNKLFSLNNFIATPHMAALTKESAGRTSKMVAEGTIAVINGEKWPYIANPEVYHHPKWQYVGV